MPCFQGLAVSIHTPDGPIPEHSIQRQQKFGRITSYIPVPAPQFGDDGNPQPSTFAVSITLLTPGLRVPYSAPKPTMDNPYPQPAIVGALPGTSSLRGQYHSAVRPYVPHTNSPNETVAAYIYFDGRQKEEVATLLRRGEETWVNSRWVSIPDSEGGGIAEREFLFREVGLERWLNGLDLSAGADKARKIQRRQRKLEKKQRIKKEQMDSDDEDMSERKPKLDRNGVLRYGGDANAPVQPVIDDDDLSEDSSDDEPPELEASGQIKVALFRVLASGEIKRGEYSPQFDVHDDEGVDGQGNIAGGEDVDHTTSFAKPKTLDPKSISTQTVTGLDPPDAPFAVFTFFYRGESMYTPSTQEHLSYANLIQSNYKRWASSTHPWPKSPFLLFRSGSLSKLTSPNSVHSRILVPRGLAPIVTRTLLASLVPRMMMLWTVTMMTETTSICTIKWKTMMTRLMLQKMQSLTLKNPEGRKRLLKV